MPRHRFPPKVDFSLCNTCPNLEFCRDFPDLPLGHHPAGRCPDGLMEKVFEWELPGPEYKRPTGQYSPNADESDGVYASFHRPGYCGYKSKWCIMCAARGKRTRTTKGSQYWLCQNCASRIFVHWKAKNHALIAKFKGRIHQGYVYKFNVKIPS